MGIPAAGPGACAWSASTPSHERQRRVPTIVLGHPVTHADRIDADARRITGTARVRAVDRAIEVGQVAHFDAPATNHALMIREARALFTLRVYNFGRPGRHWGCLGLHRTLQRAGWRSHGRLRLGGLRLL